MGTRRPKTKKIAPHPARELRPARIVAAYSYTPLDAMLGRSDLLGVAVTDSPRGTLVELFPAKSAEGIAWAERTRFRIDRRGVEGHLAQKVTEAVRCGSDWPLIRTVEARIPSFVEARMIAKRLTS